jgi:hypothetical protein
LADEEPTKECLSVSNLAEKSVEVSQVDQKVGLHDDKVQ